MSGSVNPTGVVPATLSFFAIYNPSLSHSDESIHEQIVYYYDKVINGRRNRRDDGDGDRERSKKKINERLRHVGLAQGMVQFATGFSDGVPVDHVETAKSRIIIHNLEAEWWLLASVDLTFLPRLSESNRSNQHSTGDCKYEYSAREVSPPALLLQQVLRAHQIFLLHHGTSLTEVWSRMPREKFCGFLRRFWDDYLSGWDVMLHGNPSVDIFNGLKLSAGGELGIGVGEEDSGSGEREVLEGFIERTDGLVDLIVSRFEKSPTESRTDSGTGTSAVMPYDEGGQTSSDGVIFSGIGNLTRYSIRSISAWAEWLAARGKNAYGVKDNPHSNPRRKIATKQDARSDAFHPNENAEVASRPLLTSSRSHNDPGIPGPIVRAKRDSSQKKNSSMKASNGVAKESHVQGLTELGGPAVGAEVMKYLTFGVYGSSWGIPSGRPAAEQPASSLRHEKDNQRSRKPSHQAKQNSPHGYFLIGLLGTLEEDMRTDDESQIANKAPNAKDESNNRTLVRYVHVERVEEATSSQLDVLADTGRKAGHVSHERLRVVVYVSEPFIFTFLFESQTDPLAMPSFYRSLHHQLGPLQRPLLKSTDPGKITQRLWDAASTKSTVPARNSQPIRDLVYNPARLTVHTTIPNIPEPSVGPFELSASWTRVEALSVHSQILNTYTSTRQHRSELERTCKTSRGWWVVWMRLPHSPASSALQNDDYREAFLVRKSSDYAAPKPRSTSSRLGIGWGGGEGVGNGWGSAKLAEGIGIDARQYINGLLSLSR